MKQALQKITTYFLFFLISLFFNRLHAQTLQVHGKVIDSITQEAVAGATVNSLNQNVASDNEGNFTINAEKGKNITVSFVGYGSQTVTAEDRFLTVKLSTTSSQLNEVVVTALGVRKEVKRVGYAVQQVKGEDLVKARDANPITGLQGKIAGLSVGPSAELLRKPEVLLRGNQIKELTL